MKIINYLIAENALTLLNKDGIKELSEHDGTCPSCGHLQEEWPTCWAFMEPLEPDEARGPAFHPQFCSGCGEFIAVYGDGTREKLVAYDKKYKQRWKLRKRKR